MEEILWEAFKLLPAPSDPEKRKFALHHTEHENNNRQFNHGCDIVNKLFDEEFEKAFRIV
jgi:hypothetical protein